MLDFHHFVYSSPMTVNFMSLKFDYDDFIGKVLVFPLYSDCGVSVTGEPLSAVSLRNGVRFELTALVVIKVSVMFSILSDQ